MGWGGVGWGGAAGEVGGVGGVGEAAGGYEPSAGCGMAERGLGRGRVVTGSVAQSPRLEPAGLQPQQQPLLLRAARSSRDHVVL